MHIDAPHVQRWLTEKDGALVADRALSQQFAHFLTGEPWNLAGTSLSWHNRPCVVINLNDGESSKKLVDSALSDHGHVFFIYSDAEPGLLCRTDDLLDSLDTIFWEAPGPNYFCGAGAVGSEFRLAPEAYAEYDGGEWVQLVAHAVRIQDQPGCSADRSDGTR